MTGGRPPLVALAAGGTGGHVFPAAALAVELQGRGIELVLITDRRGGALGGDLPTLRVHRIRAGGIAGKNPLRRLFSGVDLAVGTWQARRLLRDLKPDAVIGFGGYPSVPTMLAAAWGGYATAIHEQNAVLGRANRLLASRARRIAVSFDRVRGVAAGDQERLVHTGMPVRQGFAEARERAYAPPASDGPINLLVMGGSQGARVLSQVVPAALGMMPEAIKARLGVVQQCRPEDLEVVRGGYARAGIKADLAAFFDDVPARLAAAHLLIARAGASTVAEMTTVGRPAILVPYPHAIDDHQAANAHAVDEAGAGWLMPEDAFSPETLAQRLEQLFTVPGTLRHAAASARTAGRPDAALRLADLVERLLAGDTQETAA